MSKLQKRILNQLLAEHETTVTNGLPDCNPGTGLAYTVKVFLENKLVVSLSFALAKSAEGAKEKEGGLSSPPLP